MSDKPRDPGAYDIRSTLNTITLLCEPNGEPCDGFRFRQLILKARGFLAAPAHGADILGPDEDGLPVARYSYQTGIGMIEHRNGTYVRYGEVERRIALASPAQGWIEPSDGLPVIPEGEYRTDVLTTRLVDGERVRAVAFYGASTPGDVRAPGFYIEVTGRDHFGDTYTSHNYIEPTHWQALPSGPEA